MANVIIDTDPGSDDALALIMAFNSPDLDVLGITTVGGNASIQDTTRNALSIIDHLGLRDISVYQGEQHPFEGCFENAYAVHGSNGLGISLPEPTSTPSNTTAHQFITETAAVKRNNLLVITLGPLTNLALALQAEDRLAHWISRVIVMGGAVRVPGNITLYAEFNVYNDPTSAEVVFNSGIPITLIGLDVTMKTSFSEAEYPWVCGESANAHLARRILKSRFRSLQKGIRLQITRSIGRDCHN